MSRPRKPLLDAVPRSRTLQALVIFPYVCTAFLVAYLFGGDETSSSDTPLLVVFAIVAVMETAFLAAWLRRPVTTGQRERYVWLLGGGALALGIFLMISAAWVAQ
ncbi:hypothetical protein GCM10022415_15970 [Knoellia locipacati]|uniref:Uncharacterized protein n=1 Tax=Knoellia locipacati TaxID=882824 RepID=A0A512T000_9MICO|nr:hypothetical protein KLO01_15940 [Knoellia locipacati]